MAATTVVTVTKLWTQVSSNSCLLQAKNASTQYHICVQPTAPSADSDNFVVIDLIDSVVLDFATPVYARLPPTSHIENAKVVVIA